MANSKREIKRIISEIMHCAENEILNLSVMKKGMTNHSYHFQIKGDGRYILRIPGEGTSSTINRAEEAAAFRAIRPYNICDAPIYFDPNTGYKVTRFLNHIRVCNPHNENDLLKCMELLRYFHALNLSVPHEFNLTEKITLYEDLYRSNGNPGSYDDYLRTKANVISLQDYIASIDKSYCLSHIDSVCDNFLFYRDSDREDEKLQLSDWEYAGMQDPHVDIAMFCIYSSYCKDDCDRLIDLYFKGQCNAETRAKIYCYISTSGLLWSNWCEYKKCFNVTFGDYATKQYLYAKEFYHHAIELIKTIK